jgi:hypothetical protein
VAQASVDAEKDKEDEGGRLDVLLARESGK